MTDKDALLGEALPVLQAYALDNPKWYRIDHCGGPGILQDPCGVHALIPRITAALEGGKDGGWIPVGERLPEHKVTVLCAAHRVCFGMYSYDGDGTHGHWIVDDPHPDNANVTHWKPLPPLPTGDRHD